MNLDQKEHGFQLIWSEPVEELNCTANFYRHLPTGAELMHLATDDTNKTFVITFKTPPEDNTGCPHILEHSVLNGSKNFPIKDPFTELTKGSLRTFLNAFTAYDKTMYPFASMNHKDFMNLMHVYLDAVFNPNIHQYPEIFWQEGWHYELFKPEAAIIYKGVVYNEMKGAFSSPESILYRKAKGIQYPDTPYRYESGGDPDYIPELTYEKFCAFHKKYYHPSNARIFLYGDVDVAACMDLLENEYLSKYEHLDVDSDIPLQPPFDAPISKQDYYPISASEEEAGKAYLALNFTVGDVVDANTSFSFQILDYLLMETAASPLRKALLGANIAKDVYSVYDDSLRQPVFSIVLKHAAATDMGKFEKIVFDTLKELVTNGIDKKLIEGAINYNEFRLREAESGNYPKGLMVGMSCMKTWLHGADPLLFVRYERTLEYVKQALTSPLLEQMIVKYLLNNTHRSAYSLLPSKMLSEEKETATAKKLQEYKAQLSPEGLQKLIDENNRLQLRQVTPETQEALNCLPLLDRKDIDSNITTTPFSVSTDNEITWLNTPLFTDHIVYSNLIFDACAVPSEDLQYLSLLTGLLGDIKTRHYSDADLANEVNLHLGGFYFSLRSYPSRHKMNCSEYRFIVTSKALRTKLPQMVSLLREVLTETQFDDKQRILEVIRENKSALEMRMLSSGHSVAISRLNATLSQHGYFEESIKGLEFYHFLCKIEANYDAQFAMLSEKLKKVYQTIFQTNNLIISTTAEEQDICGYKAQILPFIQELPKAEKLTPFQFELSEINEGLLAPANIQFVAQAANYRNLGWEYDGSLQVLRSILNKGYYYEMLRVQGGAYGVINAFSSTGLAYVVSYRDPNLRESYEVYKGTGDFLRKFDCSDRDMLKYIIGTIADCDIPMSPQVKGTNNFEQYLYGTTDEDLQKERTAILSVTPAIIRGWADMTDQVIAQKRYCTFGNEAKIMENSDLFDRLIPVFE